MCRVSVLWWAASSSRYRWLKPWAAASSCRDRGSNRGFSRLGWSAEPTLLSLSWHKPRGGGVLASLSLAQTGGSSTSKTARNLADVARRTVRLPRVVTRRRPAPCAELARCVRRRPRVAIAGSNRGRRPPRVVIRGRPPTCTFRWAHKIPYRPACNQTPVTIVVQTRGSTSSSCR